MQAQPAPHTAPEVIDLDAELRSMLASIPTSDPAYGRWWGSTDGVRLYTELSRAGGFGDRVAAGVARTYGVGFEATDAANTLVDILRNDFVLRGLMNATRPAGYLHQVLRSALCAQAGTYFRAEVTDQLVDHNRSATSNLYTPIVEAVEITTELLAPYTPASFRSTLQEVVFYFAERGHSRISHLYTDATRDPELLNLGVNRKQVLAVANVVLGARPRHHETSILAQVLIDRDWDPASSGPHRKAIAKFARNIQLATRSEDTKGAA